MSYTTLALNLMEGLLKDKPSFSDAAQRFAPQFYKLVTDGVYVPSLDKDRAVAAINDILRLAEFGKLVNEVHVALSPDHAQAIAREVSGESSGRFGHFWVGIGSAFHIVGGSLLRDRVEGVTTYSEEAAPLIETAEAGLYDAIVIPNDKSCTAILIPMPNYIKTQTMGDRDVLHCQDGPAIEWRYELDGKKFGSTLWFVFGREASEELRKYMIWRMHNDGRAVIHPDTLRDTLDQKGFENYFLKLQNEDERAQALAVAGEEMFVKLLKLKKVDEKVFEHNHLDVRLYDKNGEPNQNYGKKFRETVTLWKSNGEIPELNRAVAVAHVIDPSKFSTHWLFVPETCEDAEDAALFYAQGRENGMTRYVLNASA